MTAKIDVAESCSVLQDVWSPRVIAALNGQEVKLIRAKGAFSWHRNHDADEFFLVWKGRFSVEFSRPAGRPGRRWRAGSARRGAPHVGRGGRVRAVLRAGRDREHRESPAERVHGALRRADLRFGRTCGVVPDLSRLQRDPIWSVTGLAAFAAHVAILCGRLDRRDRESFGVLRALVDLLLRKRFEERIGSVDYLLEGVVDHSVSLDPGLEPNGNV